MASTYDKAALKLLGAVLMIAAVGWWGYQVYAYLRHGVWVDGSVIAALQQATGKIGMWAALPSDWLGLHRLLSYVPLALLGFLLGAAIANEQ